MSLSENGDPKWPSKNRGKVHRISMKFHEASFEFDVIKYEVPAKKVRTSIVWSQITNASETLSNLVLSNMH